MKRYMAITFVLIILVGIFNLDIDAKSKFSRTWENIVREKSKELKTGQTNKLILKYELAVAYSNLGQIEKAKEIFEELDKNKEWEEKVEKIIASYDDNLEAGSQNIKRANYLAFAYYINKEYANAEKMYNNIIKLDPNNIWTYNYLAVTQHELKEYKKANKTLNKSLDIEDNQYTHFLLGANYYKMGKVFKAVYHIGKGRRAASLFLGK